MKRWIRDHGVWRQVDSTIDMALVNRDAAVKKLAEIRKDGTTATQRQRNELTLIVIKSSLVAGLGDVSLKEELL